MSRNKLKAAVFIDHSNLASPILEPNFKKNRRIDYKKLKDVLLKGYQDEGAFMFMGIPDPIPPEKKEFMNYLLNTGIFVFTRPLVRRKDGSFEQKQIDILMSFYMDWKAQSKEFDVAIIVSGDADFVIAVNVLKDMNKGVIVWSWRKSLSSQLKETVGEENVFYIDDIWEKIKK